VLKGYGFRPDRSPPSAIDTGLLTRAPISSSEAPHLTPGLTLSASYRVKPGCFKSLTTASMLQPQNFPASAAFFPRSRPVVFGSLSPRGLTNLKGAVGDPRTTEGIPMAKLFNHYHPDHAVGFGHPYSDRRPISWHYTLGYRGYDLEVAREVSAWQLGIHPRHPELPIPRHCQVCSYNSDEAVLEAKRHVDALLLQGCH
jgi:hypothetical protein